MKLPKSLTTVTTLSKSLALALYFVLAGVGVFVGYYFGYDVGYERGVLADINNYEQCRDAGYPIAESHPEQCHIPGGPTFINNRSH